ncbi:dynein regulatory complex protein 9 isoform X1 [Hippoglossus stenolepis]|uniref:dynein regulatory complex protein 9 isoform X1 n=1 Tax=Hippoglossus stenolepis TaxID=195615 RepID=UPI00159C1F15|nr:dynein regulatory complex protein 9 isoform X1 [Hippoglossus stenolepis]
MSLSKMQSLRVAAVLEDCSDQLDILGHSLTVQISREQGTEAAQERARLTKLRRDCQYIKQQTFKLHSELEEKQSFTSLLQVVEEEEQRKKAEKMRREGKKELEHKKLTLQRQQKELQQKMEKYEDLCRHRAGLRRQLDEESLQAANWRRIVEKDAELQLQQAQKRTSQAEKLLEEQLEGQLEMLQKQQREEMRVHEESNNYQQNQHQSLQQQLQQMQQRTELMLLDKQGQLNNVCRKRTVNLDKLSEMRRRFREMEEVVMEDRLEQEKLLQQQTEARAATMVKTHSELRSRTLTIMVYQVLLSWWFIVLIPNSKPCSGTFDPAAAGLVERLHGPQRPWQF